jgi:hypothetical protein
MAQNSLKYVVWVKYFVLLVLSTRVRVACTVHMNVLIGHGELLKVPGTTRTG